MLWNRKLSLSGVRSRSDVRAGVAPRPLALHRVCAAASRGKWVVASRTGPCVARAGLAGRRRKKSVPEHLNSSGSLGFGLEGGCLGAERHIGSGLYYFFMLWYFDMMVQFFFASALGVKKWMLRLTAGNNSLELPFHYVIYRLVRDLLSTRHYFFAFRLTKE